MYTSEKEKKEKDKLVAQLVKQKRAGGWAKMKLTM
jgi:hypothetical protein